eukprot:3293970-Pleurochrysis_carterae.AAC.1
MNLHARGHEVAALQVWHQLLMLVKVGDEEVEVEIVVEVAVAVAVEEANAVELQLLAGMQLLQAMIEQETAALTLSVVGLVVSGSKC